MMHEKSPCIFIWSWVNTCGPSPFVTVHYRQNSWEYPYIFVVAPLIGNGWTVEIVTSGCVDGNPHPNSKSLHESTGQSITFKFWKKDRYEEKTSIGEKNGSFGIILGFVNAIGCI